MRTALTLCISVWDIMQFTTGRFLLDIFQQIFLNMWGFLKASANTKPSHCTLTVN